MTEQPHCLILEGNEPVNNYLVQSLLTKSIVTQLVRKCHACIDLMCLPKLAIGVLPDEFDPDSIFTYYVYILMYFDMYVYMLITTCLCLGISLCFQLLGYQNILVQCLYVACLTHIIFNLVVLIMLCVEFIYEVFTPLLILSCTQIFYTQLYSCTPPASVL